MSNASQLPLTVSDVVCLDDLDANGSETTSDLQTLIQDVYHVLIEVRGSNIDDVTRGAGVELLLSGDASVLPGVAQEIETQLGQDSRIAAVTATISLVAPGGSAPDGTVLPDGGFTLDVDIQPDASIAPSAVSLSYYLAANGGLLTRVLT
jgi:hypothetical protein